MSLLLPSNSCLMPGNYFKILNWIRNFWSWQKEKGGKDVQVALSMSRELMDVVT